MKQVGEFLLRALKTIALPLAMFLVLKVLSSFIGTGSFGNALSIRTALRSAVFTCLVATGMSFNLLSNRWDYSIGASLILASIIGPNLAELLGLNATWALILCAITGVVFCTIVGLTYILIKIHPLVISMGFLLLYEGLSAVVFDGAGVNMTGSHLMDIAKYPYYMIPFVILFVLAYVLYSKTRFGYNLRAVSYGAAVAVNIGVKEKPTVLAAYALGGLFVGVAGYFNTAMNGLVWPTLDAGSVVTAFSCCVPFFVGKFLTRYGNLMVGILMGSLAIAFMNTGLTSLGVSSSLQTTINGLFLLVILVISANEARVAEYLEGQRVAKIARAKQEAAG